MIDVSLRERIIVMKTAVHWFLLGVFALQATGATWYAHLAECCSCQPPKAATCQCGHCRVAAARGFAWEDFRALRHHSASATKHGQGAPATPPGKPIHHRHDSQTCGVCQLLLNLAATAQIPEPPPAIPPVAFEQPAPSERPIADTFLSTLDARGPPACTLCLSFA
jgi:hypothetical protein